MAPDHDLTDGDIREWLEALTEAVLMLDDRLATLLEQTSRPALFGAGPALATPRRTLNKAGTCRQHRRPPPRQVRTLVLHLNSNGGGMEEAPGRLIAQLGRAVETTAKYIAHQEVEGHERRCHAIPPPDDSPITALPFADFRADDDTLSHAMEMLEEDDGRAVAAQLGIPYAAFEQVMVDYQRRRTRHLLQRARIA
jgi:hypothetical protein